MVGVKEHPVIVDYGPARRTSTEIGIALVRVIYCFIDTFEKSIHRPVNVIRPAKCPHHAALAQRIALLHRHFLIGIISSGNLRPFGNILPVPEPLVHYPEYPVQGKHRLIPERVDIFPVRTTARPVHQPRCLECGRVGKLYPDARRHISRGRLIFIRRSCSVQREQYPQPGACGRVLSCGINAVPATESINSFQNLICSSRRDRIEIKGYNIAPCYCAGLSPHTRQAACHKAADVLAVILLGFFHAQVFLHGFCRTARYPKLLIELRQHDGLRTPVYAFPVISDCDCD